MPDNEDTFCILTKDNYKFSGKIWVLMCFVATFRK